jgi:hypothetical protein
MPHLTRRRSATTSTKALHEHTAILLSTGVRATELVAASREERPAVLCSSVLPNTGGEVRRWRAPGGRPSIVRYRPEGQETAPGSNWTAKTTALESGASLMQAKAPVEKVAMYLNGFHVSKESPRMQREAHHYCNQVNEDFAQCVLFDGNTAEG